MPAGTATPPALRAPQRTRGEGRGALGLCFWSQSPGEGTSWPGKAGECAATGSRGLATRVLRTNMPQAWERNHRGHGQAQAVPAMGSRAPGWQVLMCPAGTWSKVLMAKAEAGAGAWLCQELRGRVPATADPQCGCPRPTPRGRPWRGSPVAVPGSQFPAEGPFRDRCRFHQPLPLTASLTPCRPPWTFPALASRLLTGCGCRVAWAAGVDSSGLYIVLGSPTSAALLVARTAILFWPPPVC